jgi:hypothetical protein
MPQPAIPSPHTWASGDYVLAPQLRANVSNAVALLAGRPWFIGQSANGATWASGTDGTLGLDTELDDPWNMHTVANAKLYCQLPGWYLCRCTFPFAYNSTTAAAFAAGFQWQNNGAGVGPIRGPLLWSGSGFFPTPQAVDLIEQTISGPANGSGDWLAGTGFQNTGSTISRSGNATQLPTVSARWVAAITGTTPLPVPPLGAVPSPITSAWLNANVRDTISFLTYPPIAKATYAPGSSTMASATFPAGSVVPVNAVTVDNYGGLTTGASAGYTAPVAGRYYCYGQFSLQATAVTFSLGAGFSVNGGTTQWGDVLYKTSDTVGFGAGVSKRLRLNAGDKVQLIGSQNSGSAIGYTTSAANQTRLIVVWEGL